jgi:hypothetical protein
VNALISQAPTLLGGLNTSPAPAGSLVVGNFSAGCGGVFWLQLPHGTPACKLVVPSKCTVLIQKVLLVDWLGVTFTTVFVGGVVALFLAFCANAACHVWLCIPKIIAADMIMTAIIAAEIVNEGVFDVCLHFFCLIYSCLSM